MEGVNLKHTCEQHLYITFKMIHFNSGIRGVNQRPRSTCDAPYSFLLSHRMVRLELHPIDSYFTNVQPLWQNVKGLHSFNHFFIFHSFFIMVRVTGSNKLLCLCVIQRFGQLFDDKRAPSEWDCTFLPGCNLDQDNMITEDGLRWSRRKAFVGWFLSCFIIGLLWQQTVIMHCMDIMLLM